MLALANFLTVLGQVATLFLLMSVGFALEKGNKLDHVGTEQISVLLLWVVAPCIVIDSFQVDFDPALSHTLLVGSVAMFLSYAVYFVVTLAFFRREETTMRNMLRMGAMFGNTGFMGLPLVQAVLGNGAMVYAVLNLGIFNVVVWSFGVMLVGGKEAFSPKKAVLNPGVISVVVGLLLYLTGLRLPGPIFSTVHFLGAMNTPLAMVVIGAQMARADLLSTFRAKKLYAASAIKLLLMPVVTALLFYPLGLKPDFFVAVVILSAAPTAGISSMFAETYHRHSAQAAQLVTLSTLLSILTLPVVGTLVEMLA